MCAQCYFSTISLPNGVSATAISLKCCMPNGMPIIVMHNITPKNRCSSIIHTPPQKNHNTFINRDKHPLFVADFTVVEPKGHRESIPSLKHCMPNGIPIIVIIRISPPIK